MKANRYLLLAGIATWTASLLHIAIVIGGGEWYRFFGAGEGMAQLAESGSTYPLMVTTAIAVTLAIWGLYAFSGAGLIRKLPFLKLALGIIAAVFLLRGVAGIPLVLWLDDPYLNELASRMAFMIVSSLVSLGIGLLYLIGAIQSGKARCVGLKP